MLGLPVTLPFINTGRLRALAVAEASRAPQLPDTPSISETKELHAYDLGLTYDFVAPAKTSSGIIERLHAAWLELLNSADFWTSHG
jgi:tripartite-type tricarboxylate transporter receptor subunit TctC